MQADGLVLDYRFDLEEDWAAFLDAHGYVVIKSVADSDQVAKALDLYWQHFESTKGVNRADMQSWENWRTDRRGILVDGGVIQCAGAWYLRGLPKVKQAFAKIWDTESLIVSMDSLLLWKPWWHNKQWLPMTEGLHMDQNPFDKPHKCCVQGMLPLYDVDDQTGGLEIVPDSNLPEQQEKIRTTCTRLKGIGDFCIINERSPVVTSRKLLHAKAGDLILWDSRTIHGGRVGKGKDKDADTEVRLARVTQTICMLPRSTASPGVLERRRRGFETGEGYGHWANEAEVTAYSREGYIPIELTPEQQELL